MFSALYIEEDVLDHPRTRAICERFRDIPHITIERYGEVFNRKKQNFRLQKRLPALILAHKHNNLVLPAPENYGIGGKHNYYFSHMMNCIYDCRYCFLQGMYRSAHYVLFVNYEDFSQSITRQIAGHPGETGYYFSGYDCDSLALEPVSRFTEFFLPVFRQHANAWLELRTKSTQIRGLLDTTPFENCVIAYSFTPAEVSEALEHKVPAIEKRIDAMSKLQRHGWNIGLRFDPVIYETQYQERYARLFERIFSKINADTLHSVSLGLFRMPEEFFKNIVKLYPDEKLFAGPFDKNNRKDNMVSYSRDIEKQITAECRKLLLQYISESQYFPCNP